MKGKRRRQAKSVEGKPQRQRRSAVSRVFMSFFLLLVLGLVAAAGVAVIGYRSYIAEGPLQEPKIFEVAKGLSTPEIAAALKDNGIINDDRVFSIAALATGSRGRLKAGEYEFPARASARDVMNIIASGRAIAYKVTIPEGWTTEMALARVRENEVLTGELTLAPGEGEILPETYVFRRGKTRDELVSEMVEAQKKLLDELWDMRSPNTPVKTPREAVILASIVEKETAIPEERPDVAAVFANRLRQNMRLQSDPTIIYGIVGGKGKLDRPITRSDIASKTLYNTYQINGLPPGPIANPGRAAIEAVLNPSSSKALYFVADGSGGHAFAETLDDHNANVRKWRNIERNRVLIEAQEVAGKAEQPKADDQNDEGPVAAGEQAEPEAAPTAKAPELPDMALVEESEAAAPSETPATQADTNEPASAEPQQTAGEPAASTAEPEAVQPPQAKPAAETADEPERKPGEILKVSDRLVPIPVPKPVR